MSRSLREDLKSLKASLLEAQGKLNNILQQLDCSSKGEVERPQQIEPPDEGCPPSFSGIPFTAKWDGTCAVCGGAYAEGEPILWDPDSKQRAHADCGTERPRTPR